ncbi:MAG: hypothetical protein ACC645_02900, partial [Pirellulales bacterium]
GDAPRQSETALRAAYQLGWWRAFDAAVERLPSIDRRHLWKGFRCLRMGDWRAADGHFATSSFGEPVQVRVAEGRAILNRIKSTNLATRVTALFDWETWQHEAPGPWMWREEPGLVQSCPTTAVVYSRTHDLIAQYYGAFPELPAELFVQGPVRLRIDARPLHPIGANNALDDWIVVRGEGRDWLVPISGNRVADALTVIGPSDAAAGEQCRIEIRLGPGLHRLQVAAESSKLLVQAYVARPELPLPVLPPITRSTLQAALSGHFGHARSDTTVVTGRSSRIGHDRSVRIVGASCDCKPELVPLSPAPVCAHGQIAVDLDRLAPIDASRLAMRLGTVNRQDSVRLLEWARNAESDGRDDERSEIFNRYDDDVFDGETVAAGHGDIASGREAESGRTAGTLSWAGPDRARQERDDAIRQRIIALVYRAEHEREQRLDCAAEAIRVVNAHPDIPGLSQLVARIVRGGEWVPYQQFRSTAGVHGIDLNHWSPESPRLRARKALMRGGVPADYLVAGDRRLSLRVANEQPAEYRVELEMPQISYLPLPTLHVRWRIDDQTERSAQLDERADRKTMRLMIGKGEHTFQLWLDEPFANQFLLVTLHRRQGGEAGGVPMETRGRAALGRGQAASGPPPHGPSPVPGARPTGRLTRVFDRQRLYQVATDKEPVIFLVQGPSLLRIDEKDQHGVQSRTVGVTEPVRTFTFRPDQEEGVRLIRVMQLDFRGTRRPPSVFRPLVQSDSVWEPWLSVWSAETFGPSFEEETWDGARAGANLCRSTSSTVGSHSSPWETPNWRDHATWSLAAGWVHRRNLEEFSRSSAPDRFAQVDASRYSYNAWTGSYSRRNLLTRARESAGTTVGLVEDRWWSLSPGTFGSLLHGATSARGLHESLGVSSIRLQTRGSFYLQEPGDPIAPADNELEWSGMLQARLSQHRDLTLRTYHIPSALLLGRRLSMKRDQYAPGQVDQDIFTQYKRNHPTGLRLADTFTYQPTLDTRWWVRPRLFTNEDFDLSRPDNISLRLGHSQLIGPLQCDLSYRITRYYRDHDRRRNSNQQVVYFDAIFEQWRSTRFQWEVHGGARHDTSNGGTTAFVRFEAFRSSGRGYRDRYPASAGFLNLRKQRRYEAVDW